MKWIASLSASVIVGILCARAATAYAQDTAPTDERPPAATRTFDGDVSGLRLDVSEDGRRLAAMSGTGRLVVWEISSAAPIAVGDAGAHTRSMRLVDRGKKVVAEVGRYLAEPSRVLAFDVATGKQLREWKSHIQDPTSLQGALRLAGVLPRENAVGLDWGASRSSPAEAVVVSLETFEAIESVSLPEEAGRFVVTRDGRRIVTGKGVFDLATGEAVWKIANAGAFAGREDVKLSQGDQVTLAGLAEGASAVLFQATAPGPRFVTIACDLADGSPLYVLADAYDVATSSGSDPRIVVARATESAHLEIVDGRTGRTLGAIEATGKVSAAALSPDGKWAYVLMDDAGTIAAIALDGSAKPAAAGPGADATRPKPVRPPARKLGAAAMSFAVSRDGEHLAAAASGRVVVWSTAQSRPLHEIEIDGALPSELAFASNGTTLLAGVRYVGIADRAPEILQWEVASGRRRGGIPSLGDAQRTRSPGRSETGDVSLAGTPGPLDGVLARFANVSVAVLDPDTARPLNEEHARQIDLDDVAPAWTHFSGAIQSIAFGDSGAIVAYVFESMILVKSWPELRSVRAVRLQDLPEEYRDVVLHRVWLCGSDERIVCEAAAPGKRPRDESKPLVLGIDLGTDGVAVPWTLPGGAVLDVARGDRPELLAATKKGVELIDATTGRSLSREASAGDDVSHALFVPGTRYAWIVKGKTGSMLAVNLPE